MPQNESADPPVEPAEPAIATYGRVAVRTDGSGGPVAHRPGQFLALGDASSIADALASWAASVRIDVETLEFRATESEFPGGWRRYTLAPSVDVLALVRGLRLRGIAVQPNHVYFVTSLGAQAVQFTPNMFAPNMFAPNMFAPNMFAPNMFAPNMFAPNMFAPNMFAPNMFAGGGGCCCPPGPVAVEQLVVPKLAARPGGPQSELEHAMKNAVTGSRVDIHVIDVANPGPPTTKSNPTGELTGTGDEDARSVDSNDDRWADPALCHGGFVTSIVEIGSGVTATLWEASDPLGDIDDTSLVTALQAVVAGSDATKVRLLNLSLSGYNEDDRPNELLAGQIATMIGDGWVIVAAAGNNASCRLAWPAALPDVVAVGALSDCAPAWFSNYGPWVDVSAPGVDVLGRFAVTAGKGEDLDKILVAEASDPTNTTGKALTAAGFTSGWATWSGTSFAAPFVTARIAKAIEDDPTLDGKQAVKKVVDDSTRDWVPYYGRLLR
jgi:hypothetical protein